VPDAFDALVRLDERGELVRVGEPPADPSEPLRVVSLKEFAAVEEEGAEALLGTADNALIPQGGNMMIYGDGGAGKTTACVDLGCHLGAGDDWLGITIARPVRVLLIENEGPRPLLRGKLRRKLAEWEGSPLDDRVRIVEEPWARFTFAEPAWRDKLAATIQDEEFDVVIVGPLTALGMLEAGTMQQTRAFADLLDAVRDASGRPVTFIVVHHENKGGAVSGAWEGVGEGLWHVLKRGHGRTALYFQKARWASEYHGKTLELTWAPGEGFEVEDKDIRDDETVKVELLDYVRQHPGTSWTPARDSLEGVGKEQSVVLRDALLVAGELVNLGKDGKPRSTVEPRTPSRLYTADDPALLHLGQTRGPGPAQVLFPTHKED
jgi:hypothetical protein